MKEVAFSIGPDKNLVGVVTLAEGKAEPLAILIMNAGVLHRIGPHRTSVKIARQLARRGFTSVRFDISGIGDSRPPRDALSFDAQAIRDTRIVMDHVQKTYGVDGFALYGICDGAMNGYATALADDRVQGLFMFDGFTHLTAKAYATRLYLRLHERSLKQHLEWAGNKLAAYSRALSRARKGPRDEPLTTADAMPHFSKDEFAKGLQSLSDRGLSMVNLYTGSLFEKYSYESQFRDTFKGHEFVNGIVLHYCPEMDHLVTALEVQEKLAELVVRWARQTCQSRPSKGVLQPAPQMSM
jgi:pimeloyl-ACP methyl ester carboxylesterase